MIDSPSWQHFATHDESEYPELWQGVRGYWAPCLGPSGTRLHDVGGLNNWGTLTNMDAASDWVVDGGRYALDFDGSNDFVSTVSSVQIANQMSVSFWFKRATAAQHRIILNREFVGGVSRGFDCYLSATNQIGFFRGTTITSPASVVVINAWQHVVVSVRGSSGLGFFVNGKSVGTSAADATILSSSAIVTIGRFNSPIQDFFPGQLDEIILYDRPVSAVEAAQLYQIGRGGMLTPRRRLKAYFAGVSGLRRRLLLTGQV